MWSSLGAWKFLVQPFDGVHLDDVNSAPGVLVPLHILSLDLILSAAVEPDAFSYGHVLLQSRSAIGLIEVAVSQRRYA